MDLINLLQNVLSDNVIGSLNRQMPQAQPQQTNTAAQLAISAIMNALAKNTTTDQGINGLMGALNSNHDGGILENLMDYVGGNTPQSKATDGMGILSHLFGGNIFNIVELISKGSGLSRNNSMSTLMKMAPIALGMLGQMNKRNNMQANDMRSLLNASVQQERQRNQESSLIEKLLDKDGDGDIKDEMLQMGMKALGNFFRK